MKRCTYCGKEYPDEASTCAVDGEPLATFPPAPESEPVKPAAEEKIVTVEIFQTRETANLAAGKLQAYGISSWLKSDDAGGMYPNLTLAQGVRLLVRESDAKAAIALLKAQLTSSEISELDAQAASTTPPIEETPKTKWAIGQIFIGIIVGVLLTLLYQWTEKQGTKTYYHYATNGQMDEAWIYQDGHIKEFRQDRNLDGQWDHRAYYENGREVRSEYDNNFDGKPDLWWTFSDDGTEMMEKDTDFNGVPDEFCTYKKRIIQEYEVRPNGTKFAITKEIFSNDILTEILRGGDSNGNFKEVEKYDPFFNRIDTNRFQSQSSLK